MRVENAAWVQVSGQPTETWIVGPMDGPATACINRLAVDSIAWEWRFLRDKDPQSGILIATDRQDVKEFVEQALVNAGIARFRGQLLG